MSSCDSSEMCIAQSKKQMNKQTKKHAQLNVKGSVHF